MKIHHVGYLVKKFERAINEFEALGYVATSEKIYDDYRKIDLIFLEKDGYTVELVSPTQKDSVVYDLLKKLGNSAYHICYEVSDIDASVSDLTSKGYVCFDEPHEAVAFSKRRVVFLIHPYLGMIELLETVSDNK